MNAAAIDRSCAAEILTKEQRQRLAMLSRDAFSKQPGLVQGATKFDLWRHEQSIKCCGRRITEATQRDFLTLKAHFLNLAGKPVAAMQAHMRAETEPERVALYKLTRECADRGLAMAYPESICRRQYRCALAEASAKQIWCLVYTIRNRRAPAKSVAPRREEPAENFDDVNDDNIPF